MLIPTNTTELIKAAATLWLSILTCTARPLVIRSHHGLLVKTGGHAEHNKQDEGHNHFLALPSASHQILPGNSECNSYTSRSLSVSVQHRSRLWSELLIPANEGKLPF